VQGLAAVKDMSLSGLDRKEWVRAVSSIAGQCGAFHNLSTKHSAAFINNRGARTLFVTFEPLQGVIGGAAGSRPLGWDYVTGKGWAHLGILSDGDTWFRDNAVYRYFDLLTDRGLFDRYQNVLFYGAGPAGYAAAAYSVASPGSTVVAVQPQATLDPRVANWDDRFAEMRRIDFTSRYGFAPDMLDAAMRAYILFDPAEQMDAMHAALFTRPAVTKLRMPHMGGTLQSDLIEMKILPTLLEDAVRGTLTAESFARLYRKRRSHTPYLRRLMSTLERSDREELAFMLAKNVTARMKSPELRRRTKVVQPAMSGG